MARTAKPKQSKQLDLVALAAHAAERRLQPRRVYLGVRHGCYSALFCTRAPVYGRVSIGHYRA